MFFSCFAPYLDVIHHNIYTFHVSQHLRHCSLEDFRSGVNTKGILVYLYLPNGVLTVHRSELALISSLTCQYPQLASSVLNTLASEILDTTSSIFFMGKCSISMAWFSSSGSRQILTLSLFLLVTVTMLLTQAVGFVTFSMTFRFSIQFSNAHL